jgi:hypothetical protein
VLGQHRSTQRKIPTTAELLIQMTAKRMTIVMTSTHPHVSSVIHVRSTEYDGWPKVCPGLRRYIR